MSQSLVEAGQPVLENQNRFDGEALGREQDVQHHLAFGNEAALPASEIALANVEIGGDARVLRVVDTDWDHVHLADSHRPGNPNGFSESTNA